MKSFAAIRLKYIQKNSPPHFDREASLSGLWTAEELVERVIAAGHKYSTRTLRYHVDRSLIASPLVTGVGKQGRRALFGPKHLSQVLMLKKMQGERLSNREIKKRIGSTSAAWQTVEYENSLRDYFRPLASLFTEQFISALDSDSFNFDIIEWAGFDSLEQGKAWLREMPVLAIRRLHDVMETTQAPADARQVILYHVIEESITAVFYRCGSDLEPEARLEVATLASVEARLRLVEAVVNCLDRVTAIIGKLYAVKGDNDAIR